MQSYLQLQVLWEVTGGGFRIPAQPQTLVTGTDDQAVRTPPTEQQMAKYNAAMAKWNTEDNKARGAIRLCINTQLQHYCTANQTTCGIWMVLAQTFGATSMSAVYADFKQVIRLKLSRGNPIPEIEQMATLFGHLTTNNYTILVAQYVVSSKMQGFQPFLSPIAVVTARTFPAAAAARAICTQKVQRGSPGEGKTGETCLQASGALSLRLIGKHRGDPTRSLLQSHLKIWVRDCTTAYKANHSLNRLHCLLWQG